MGTDSCLPGPYETLEERYTSWWRSMLTGPSSEAAKWCHWQIHTKMLMNKTKSFIIDCRQPTYLSLGMIISVWCQLGSFIGKAILTMAPAFVCTSAVWVQCCLCSHAFPYSYSPTINYSGCEGRYSMNFSWYESSLYFSIQCGSFAVKNISEKRFYPSLLWKHIPFCPTDIQRQTILSHLKLTTFNAFSLFPLAIFLLNILASLLFTIFIQQV